MIIDLSHTILAYNDINTYVLNYIGGMTLSYLVVLYLISYVFQFCYLYRIPLYYITTTNLIALIDVYYGISLSDLNMLRLYFGLVGVSIVSYIYLKYKKKC